MLSSENIRNPMKSHLLLFTLAAAFAAPLWGFAADAKAPAVVPDTTQPVEKAKTPHERAKERAALDAKTFTPEEQREIERLYQSGSRNLKTPEAQESLKKLVAKYPKSNRAGCAVQYLGQMSKGKEMENYFKTAIKDHSDAYYYNGVQVGAYARVYLARHYQKTGKTKEAAALFKDVSEKYPDAINHSGKPLLRDTKK